MKDTYIFLVPIEHAPLPPVEGRPLIMTFNNREWVAFNGDGSLFEGDEEPDEKREN